MGAATSSRRPSVGQAATHMDDDDADHPTQPAERILGTNISVVLENVVKLASAAADVAVLGKNREELQMPDVRDIVNQRAIEVIESNFSDTQPIKLWRPGRFLVHHGVLNWESNVYGFLLFNDLLVATRLVPNSLGRPSLGLVMQATIDPSHPHFIVDDLPDHSAFLGDEPVHRFRLHSGTDSFVLTATTAKAKEVWLHRFRNLSVQINFPIPVKPAQSSGPPLPLKRQASGTSAESVASLIRRSSRSHDFDSGILAPEPVLMMMGGVLNSDDEADIINIDDSTSSSQESDDESTSQAQQLKLNAARRKRRSKKKKKGSKTKTKGSATRRKSLLERFQESEEQRKTARPHDGLEHSASMDFPAIASRGAQIKSARRSSTLVHTSSRRAKSQHARAPVQRRASTNTKTSFGGAQSMAYANASAKARRSTRRSADDSEHKYSRSKAVHLKSDSSGTQNDQSGSSAATSDKENDMEMGVDLLVDAVTLGPLSRGRSSTSHASAPRRKKSVTKKKS